MTKPVWSLIKTKSDLTAMAKYRNELIHRSSQLNVFKTVVPNSHIANISKIIFRAIAFTTISLATSPTTYAASQRICPAQLQQEVKKITQFPDLQASRIGVFVKTNAADDATSQVLVNLDGDRYFIPASNTKLFVTAAALKTLGAGYQFTTKLTSISPPNAQGELDDGLWVIASGDPSFSSDTGLKSLVQQLRDRGIRRINGGIWALTLRQGSGVASSWEWSDLQEYYAAIPSPFTINENALDWSINPTQVGEKATFIWKNPELAKDWQVVNQTTTAAADAEFTLQVNRPYGERKIIITGQIPQNASTEKGAVAIPNPKENFLYLLRQELTAQGIAVVDSPTNVSNAHEIYRDKQLSMAAHHQSQETQDLAISLSPPLSKIILTTNKGSNNLYAELLLRAIGEMPPHTQKDSLNDGIENINRYLQSINISTSNIALADGSGLSRHNLTTPRTIVRLLQTFANDPNFRQSLPVAGVDGTLLRRFRDTPAQGLIQAKTGSLTGSLALSGYAKPPKHREVIFSIIINNGNIPAKNLQQYVDAIALLLTRLEDCSQGSP